MFLHKKYLYFPIISLLILFGFSLLIRYESIKINTGFAHVDKEYEEIQKHRHHNYEVSGHSLAIMQSWEKIPFSKHLFLNTTSPGQEELLNLGKNQNLLGNQNVLKTEDSFLENRWGVKTYVSFPPLGFLSSYGFLKLFHLEIDHISLKILNLSLQFSTVLLIFFLILKLLSPLKTSKIILFSAFVGSLIYLFSTESLHSHVNSYWVHQFIQPFFLVIIFLYLKHIKHLKKSSFWSYFLFILCFYICNVEWTGYFLNASLILTSSYFFLKTKDKKHLYDAITFSLLSLLALISLMIWMSLAIPPTEIWSQLSKRILLRSLASPHISLKSGLETLFLSYYRSYQGYLFVMILLGGLLFSVKVFNKTKTSEIKETFLNFIDLNITFFILLFINLENIMMLDHTFIYTFDRLKFGLFLSIFSGAFIAFIYKKLECTLYSKAFLCLITFLLIGTTYQNINHYLDIYGNDIEVTFQKRLFEIPCYKETDSLIKVIRFYLKSDELMVVNADGDTHWYALMPHIGFGPIRHTKVSEVLKGFETTPLRKVQFFIAGKLPEVEINRGGLQISGILSLEKDLPTVLGFLFPKISSVGKLSFLNRDLLKLLKVHQSFEDESHQVYKISQVTPDYFSLEGNQSFPENQKMIFSFNVEEIKALIFNPAGSICTECLWNKSHKINLFSYLGYLVQK